MLKVISDPSCLYLCAVKDVNEEEVTVVFCGLFLQVWIRTILGEHMVCFYPDFIAYHVLWDWHWSWS